MPAKSTHFIVLPFQNLNKAIQMFTKAIEKDKQLNYLEAYHLYCDGLQYFVPVIQDESNAVKKQQLKEQANVYIQRAEVMKMLLKTATNNTTESQKILDAEKNTKEKIEAALQPSHNFKVLCKFTILYIHLLLFFLRKIMYCLNYWFVNVLNHDKYISDKFVQYYRIYVEK